LGPAPRLVINTSEQLLLDVRPDATFLAGHDPQAAHIALEELSARAHELPPKTVALRITDTDPERSRSAADLLRKRGHAVVVVPWEQAGRKVPGPSRVRLWRPNLFLVEALEAIRMSDRHRPALMRRAMDLACGSGRDAVFLALQGYDVLGVDHLPDALHRAQDLATRSGVHIETRVINLEKGGVVPAGPFDLVTVFRYLHRPLFPAIRDSVARGGHVVYETFHEQNLQTGHTPKSPAHLLKTGELAEAFAGFQVLISRDALLREGRFFSQIVARRVS